MPWDKLYNFRCCLQKLLLLLEILLEARVGIEAKDGTGSIEFIDLTINRNGKTSPLSESEHKFSTVGLFAFSSLKCSTTLESTISLRKTNDY